MKSAGAWAGAGRFVAGVLLAAVVIGALTGAGQIQAARERLYPRTTETEDAVYLTSGEALRHLTVGFNTLAADLYWIRALQHYGSTKRRLAGASSLVPPSIAAASSDYLQLYPLLDITTTLDPRFKVAYRFGAIFLAESYPTGPGRPDLAVRLLEKGLRAQPDKWEYMQDIGFVHYWYDHDYHQAAERFRQAAAIPGSPWWLASLAATTSAEGGDRRSSRTMWQSIQESSESDWQRRDAARRLTQLDALDQIDQLQGIVDRETRKTGRPVTGWLGLVRARILPGLPVDPAGVPYGLSPDGRVRMDASSPLSPLPQEPQRLGAAPVS